MSVFKLMYKDSKKIRLWVSYVMFLYVKRGRNPSRKYGHCGLYVSLKLFFLDF